MNIQMTSVLANLKQIPTDTAYFISIVANPNLKIFNPDPLATTTSYVSGAAPGNFTSSNPGSVALPDASGTLSLFRDMGETIVSSGRTFRGVQLLKLDGSLVNGTGGGTGWTSSNAGVAGVWKPSNEGVQGSPTGVAGTASDFGVFYFETGARGLGVAQGLVRYG
jgi:hypothetical protein